MRQADRDPAAILAALGMRETTSITRAQGGWDTAIWRVESGGEVYALRVFRAEQAAQCQHEIEVMTAAAVAVPVPRVHASTTWQDRPALLLSWVSGEPVMTRLFAAPQQARRLGALFGEIQARVHGIDLPSALRSDAGRWISWAGDEEQELQARMRSLAAPEQALLHLDYHPLNVMTDGERITGVLDWANARVGDRRADIARTASILHLTPGKDEVRRGWKAKARRDFIRGWREGYGLPADQAVEMPAFHAWAGAAMAHDLRPKLGQPGVTLEPRHLHRIVRWTSIWKRRAGIKEGGSER